MLLQAVEMFESTLKSTSQMRNNTVSIQKYPTWKGKAMKHNIEAIELSAHAAEEVGRARWKLKRFDDAQRAFIQAADTEQVLELVGCEGVAIPHLATLLCRAQHSVMVLAEMSGLELEKTQAKDKSQGEKFLQITCHAFQCAIKISEIIADFATKHSINCDENFLTIEDLKVEKNAISELWESRLKSYPKGSGGSDLIGAHLSAHQHTIRGELQIDHQRLPPLPDRRRILVIEGNTSTRRKTITKKSIANERRNVAESFYSAFGDSSDASAQNPRRERESTHLPWGNDVLHKYEVNKYPACCPPLPADMPHDVRRAIEAKMARLGIVIGQ